MAETVGTAGPARIKVAAAQYPIERLADMGALKSKLARWVVDAADVDADLVVFPEYGAMEIAGTLDDRTAGDLRASLQAVARLKPEIDAFLLTLAVQYGIHILTPSGPAFRPDGSYANTACLVTPAAKSGVQEKMIMTPFERNWGVTGGAGPQVFDTALGRIGVLICYDSEFPLSARSMAQAGARLILVPACTERVSGFNRVRTAALARALENTIATVMSATIGDAPWSPAVDRNSGAAGIFVPAEAGVSDTGVLAEGELNHTQLVIGEIDFAHLASLQASGEMRNSADWALQPGADAVRTVARVVDLRLIAGG